MRYTAITRTLRVFVVALLAIVPTAEALSAGGSPGKLRQTVNKAVDLFKPLYYALELKVASQSIPNVSDMDTRMTLKENPFDASKGIAFDHSKWDVVLKRHVKVGTGTIGDVSGINMVDYEGITKDADFAAYLQQLEEAGPSKLQPAEQLAFWMNAYNALCINVVVQHEKKNKNVKVDSITNLTTKDSGPVWDQIAGKVAGEELSLNNIEHDNLRKVWDEPLVHACINCASASCPNLRPEAFVVDRLETQMDEQMREWLKNDSKGLRLTDENRLELSRIFLWFGADFGNSKGIRKFLPHYIEDEKIRNKIAKDQVTVRYFEYGWQINRA
mmetsp:Transcript_53616/g.79684  ORF Transcript_53616/g.79684 Transcript_53616/m.79684 type:complete len:329 (+) Transcript_53616:83-1069(+)|eukprot:CAMPEP_0195520340 /NCGR_PEP_ID=MMETSP0794_2-20130614/16659_1 /TAXON_ID=515487 /ORGANISM="Stephanopyxis turris, Strain CCMP 815" /LENGTH=328 /DNA_ID=CAMNT_0040649675 /DNA_START=83 /DNA_END=1069 /DNA_ORIENTATION=+